MTSMTTIEQLQDLLLWARKERIVLSSVTLGDVTVSVDRDYGLVPPSGPSSVPERKKSIFEQYAGALMHDEPAPGSLETIVEDDET